MKLTGQNVKNIRKYLKMSAKDFAKKAGLLGKYGAVSVYRWERGTVTGLNKLLPNIKKMVFANRLTSVMYILTNIMGEIEGIPEKIDFIIYPDEGIYNYFNGAEALPFILYQETNNKVIDLIKKLGIAVSFFEVTKETYTRWLENRKLPDTRENRVMFIGNYG